MWISITPQHTVFSYFQCQFISSYIINIHEILEQKVKKNQLYITQRYYLQTSLPVILIFFSSKLRAKFAIMNWKLVDSKGDMLFENDTFFLIFVIWVNAKHCFVLQTHDNFTKMVQKYLKRSISLAKFSQHFISELK